MPLTHPRTFARGYFRYCRHAEREAAEKQVLLPAFRLNLLSHPLARRFLQGFREQFLVLEWRHAMLLLGGAQGLPSKPGVVDARFQPT